VLSGAGLKPRVQVFDGGSAEPWVETMIWRKGDRYCLAVLKNISEFDDPELSMRIIDAPAKQITIRVNFAATNFRNIRTRRVFADGFSVADLFTPWEANLYEFGVRR
jgi:hypothetical protein